MLGVAVAGCWLLVRGGELAVAADQSINQRRRGLNAGVKFSSRRGGAICVCELRAGRLGS